MKDAEWSIESIGHATLAWPPRHWRVTLHARRFEGEAWSVSEGPIRVAKGFHRLSDAMHFIEAERPQRVLTWPP